MLGEHAVVYGRLAIAMGIKLYAKARVSKTKSKTLAIDIPQLNIKGRFGKEELEQLYSSYKSKRDIADYLAKQHIDQNVLPFATIAARMLGEFKIDPTGNKVSMHSDIPIQKGLASSAALSTVFVVGLLKSTRSRLEDSQIIDLSRDGDRVIHLNENAGRIDVSTAFYGGYTTFSSANGAKREDIQTAINLLIIDTGPKKSTAHTVGHVAELYKNDKATTEKILDQIDECSVKGLDALKRKDLRALGKCMYDDQMLLEKLGVSSESLEKAVDAAKKCGAYGAKLSGGGGGGIAIALVRGKKERLLSDLNSCGFTVLNSKVSFIGAKSFLD
ncbi:MAG: mevalonate kinase [Candidatus Micrarchaeota archaeon]|nr:mevalonate kinase [Candidatus Micrarchaeota archaeon]